MRKLAVVLIAFLFAGPVLAGVTPDHPKTASERDAPLAMWDPVDASFKGCSNGSCGIRIPNARVSPQPGAVPGQKVYCPVSGVVLEIKDSTPKRDVGGKPVYMCCDACARYFEANRERVLALRGLRPAS